ncbi:MAG: ABC transporter ATP-binding protein [Actinobacteria bacterium]|nr:ABC transporter ATP-binding protein [Actinomycetota bacterium]
MRGAACEGGSLSARSVFKIYKMDGVEVRAVQGVDLYMEPGDYAAIMGPSGSGKSTILNIVGCLDRPTSGSVCVDGMDTGGMQEREMAALRNRCIGFVFQSFHLLSRTSAVCNVEVPLLYRGMGRRERRGLALAALEEVGLGHRAEHLPSQLSGGEQQRVAIARALVSRPRIILADEPTGNLDSRSGEGILRILDGAHERGITLLLVTHDHAVAERAQRIIHFNDGRIVREERPGGSSATCCQGGRKELCDEPV